MPTAWVPGYSYDWTMSRTYTIPTGHGKRRATVVVGTTTSGGYWHIEETRWTDPPAIASPDAVRTVKGVRYLQFYNGTQLHMVAWKIGGTLYWVTNTLDNELAERRDDGACHVVRPREVSRARAAPRRLDPLGRAAARRARHAGRHHPARHPRAVAQGRAGGGHAPAARAGRRRRATSPSS